jgi:hypothetical protein
MEREAKSTRKPTVPSRLPKWKKNEIFKAIQEVGLDPKEFDLKNNDSEVRIQHKWSMSCFTVVPDPSHYVGSRVVGDGVDWPIDLYSWESLIERIRSWLEDVKRDLEMPDLWAELQRDAQLLFGAPSDDTENTPFTPDEQNDIAARLQALAEHARRTYSLSAAQMRTLEAKLDYLADAARRLGRKDWLNVCAGAILGYILTASLPPEAARGMFLGLLQAVGYLYGLPDMPLLPC